MSIVNIHNGRQVSNDRTEDRSRWIHGYMFLKLEYK